MDSVGKFVTFEAATASRGGDPGVRKMEVVLGQRNKGMNEINDPSILQEERIFGFGSKGPLMVQGCMMEETSEDRERRTPYFPNFRIILKTILFHHYR